MRETGRQMDGTGDRPAGTGTLEARPSPPGHAPDNGYDRDSTLHGLVGLQAARRPHAVALSFGDAAIDYATLERRSTRLAGELRRLGVGTGDLVGLLLPRALNTVVAKLAILKAGAAYAPLDPAYPAEHLAYMIDDCRPKCVLAAGGSAAAVPAAADRIEDLDALLARAGQADDRAPDSLPHVSAGDPAYVMYTSGSTGRPKGVVVPHRGVVRLVRAQNYIAFRPDDAVLHAATISFDAATFEIWGALLNGCRLVGIAERTLSLSRIERTIRRDRVTVMLLTTGLFNMLVDHQSEPLDSLRHVLFGGEVASADHARRFMRANPGCMLTNAYGPTEATVMASAHAVTADSDGDIPIGRPLAHGDVHILDERLVQVPAGEEGQLAVSGDGLAIGYLNRPELTAERFVTIRGKGGAPVRCYLTGDRAVMDETGTLHFRGRRDRQVKIDGKRIELDEIEAALRRDTRLADAVVQNRDDTGIVAYLRPHTPPDRDPAALAEAVLSQLRKLLPAHMVPGRAVVMERFPMNRAGKVDRARLPAPPETPAPGARDGANTGTEAMLAGLWQRVLGTRPAGPEQNFFELGATSMQMMRVHAALEKELGRDIDAVRLFRHPNLRALARFLDGGEAHAADTAAAVQSRARMQKRAMARFHRSAR